jgi:hypothetical protein
VILEHLVLGLHTCLVPVLLSSPLLSCIPCLGSALQYILYTCSVYSFPVCITSTSILASLRCTCFDIARQILSILSRHSGQTPPIVHVGHYGRPTVTCKVVKSTMGTGTETGVSTGSVWENGIGESAMAPVGYSKSLLPSEDIYLIVCWRRS